MIRAFSDLTNILRPVFQTANTASSLAFWTTMLMVWAAFLGLCALILVKRE